MKQVNIRIPKRILALFCGLILSLGAFAQQITVNGHVKDATGEDVIGATVRVVGQDGGTVTDFDGNFSLKANPGDKIEISFIGYENVVADAAANMNIIMRDDAAQTLNEVVVIGYGVAKKSDLTGSVAALKPDSKNKGLVVNPQDLMQGKIAGVNVTSGDGTPGGGATIRIRGGSSLNASNDPLIVIDGVPMDNSGVKGLANPLSMINPQDIESFNVLKDASATAIYGSRGSNGVIIITTKKGRKGQKPSISYAGSATVSLNKSTLDVMDGDEYRSFIKKIWGEKSEAYAALGTANTDWQKEIYRTGISHDHNVTVAGAAANLPYRLSLGYTGQEGTLKNSDFQRVTAALNLNPSILDDHLTMNLNAKGMFAKSDYANSGAVGAAFRMDPTQDPHAFTSPYYVGGWTDANGEFHEGLLGSNSSTAYQQTLNNFGGYFEWLNAAAYGNASWPYTVRQEATKNPLGLLAAYDTAYSRSFIGSADFDYKVHGFEDLRLHLTLGADISKGTQYTDNPYTYSGSIYYGSKGSSTITKRNLTLSTYAQYYKDFAKVHHFDIMAGYEWQRFWRSEHSDYVGFNRDEQNNPTTERPHTPYLFKTENYLVSFFGRANYSLLDRYMLTFTIRDDGSSRFEDHWSIFPSAAFAWRINDEPFLKNATTLSDLKLRLGWGKTGQQDVGNDYGWIPTYSMSTGTNGFYPITGTGVLYRPDNYTPNLKWETTETFNVGLDWGVMNQRLSGSIDWYYRKTTDLLNYAPTKPLSAFRNQAWQNIGSLKNTGIEVTVDWKAIQTKDFFWTLNGNFTYNHNEITDLSGVSTDGSPVPTGPTIGTDKYLQYNQVGYATNSFYVYQQVYDANGKAIEGLVVDRNGDGQITQDDRYFYKKPAPDVTLGLASRMEWKNWDFSFSLRANFNNYVFNNIESGQACVNPNEVWSSLKYLSNRPTFVVEDNWQTYNVEALLSDRYVHNASFLKCDNITLGYSFDRLFKSGSYNGVSGRVYATASNVFTITKYDGLDPEISGGYDNEMYPRPLSFIVGLNLNF
ncbi:MAG: TonB-dependent receptor [Prevotella sp.]|nr:TonB-dependent receptor [Prevotella sp.]